MSALTIRFIFDPSLVSRLIAWTTDSLWCHTEALSRNGESWIGAHAGTGVQARPLNWTKVTRERRYAIPVTDAQYDAAMSWMEDKIGEPYDYADIVGLGLHDRKAHNSSELICSSFMLEWMTHAGLLPLNVLPRWAYLITPETLHLSPLFAGRCIYNSPADIIKEVV